MSFRFRFGTSIRRRRFESERKGEIKSKAGLRRGPSASACRLDLSRDGDGSIATSVDRVVDNLREIVDILDSGKITAAFAWRPNRQLQRTDHELINAASQEPAAARRRDLLRRFSAP